MKPTAALFAGVFLAAGLLAGCGQPGPSLSAPADSAPEAVEAVDAPQRTGHRASTDAQASPAWTMTNADGIGPASACCGP